MKILHLLGDRRLPHDPDRESASGVVRAALELAREQVVRGHAVTVATVGTKPRETSWHGTRLVTLRGFAWARASVRGRTVDFRAHLPYMVYAAAQRPDVVHSHNYHYLRFLRSQRRVTHFHADPYYYGARATRSDFSPADFALVSRSTDAQIANSRFIATQARRGLGPVGNVHTVYYGVDQRHFDATTVVDAAAALRAEWGVQPGDAVLLYAGAIVPEKGVLHLARAFQRLADPGVRLILAGGRTLWGGAIHREDDGGYDRLVLESLSDGVASGHVRFLGNVPAAEMPAVYSAADVLVVPSIWTEAFGMVALEAAACGRPVIASSTGGLAEIVPPEMGIQVPPGDEDALCVALRALVSDPERRRRMGDAARQHASSFNWARTAEQVDEVYRAPVLSPSLLSDLEGSAV